MYVSHVVTTTVRHNVAPECGTLPLTLAGPQLTLTCLDSPLPFFSFFFILFLDFLDATNIPYPDIYYHYNSNIMLPATRAATTAIVPR